MIFVSHAQFFEDVFLWRCFKDQDSGFYIDLGAAWPAYHSITKSFYDLGWCGINVEPNFQLYSMLCEQRQRDLNMNIAVDDVDGEIKIAIFENSGLSTADSEVLKKHLSNNLDYT